MKIQAILQIPIAPLFQRWEVRSLPFVKGICEKIPGFPERTGDVGKTVERLPFSGSMIRIENHVRRMT